jgi:hypothetical protein
MKCRVMLIEPRGAMNTEVGHYGTLVAPTDVWI